MEIEVKISGSGSQQQVINALRQLASEIENGDHLLGLKRSGKCTWEDEVLLTEISEYQHESFFEDDNT